eukprot:GHVP01031887.1.p2 GENE.GHVP01031887.1~~GHVP01031887.1.p2  ORF type:complete len:109 (-),score=2.85 GHVP01031887.1:776-1102(-)
MQMETGVLTKLYTLVTISVTVVVSAVVLILFTVKEVTLDNFSPTNCLFSSKFLFKFLLTKSVTVVGGIVSGTSILKNLTKEFFILVPVCTHRSTRALKSKASQVSTIP